MEVAEKTDTKVAVLEEKLSGFQDLVEAKMETMDTKMDHLAHNFENTMFDINAKFDILFSKMDRLHNEMTAHIRDAAHISATIEQVKSQSNDTATDLKKIKSSFIKAVLTFTATVAGLILNSVWDKITGK